MAVAVPSDVADGWLKWFQSDEAIADYDWTRVWIETESGELVHEIRRKNV